MSRFIRSATLTALIICFLAPALAWSETATFNDLPEWLRSYPGADPRVKSSVENGPGRDVTVTFATDDPPERVAEIYTQKLSAAGLKPSTETSRSSGLNEIRINNDSQKSPQVNINIQAAPWLTASLPDPGKRTKVNIYYREYTPLSSQGFRWDESWPLIVVLPVGVLFLLFWIWMLIDCVTKEAEEGNTKLVWVGIILVTPVIGALLYLSIRRPQRKAELGR
jgi:hypothetical protein